MRHSLNTQYIAGALDLIGGFAVHKNPSNKKHYLYFKVVTEGKHIKKIMDFLSKTHKIAMNHYVIKGKMTFYVTRQEEVEKLISFMKTYCYRQDYKKYRKTAKGWKKL